MGYPRRNIVLIALLMEGGALVIALILAEYFDVRLFPLSVDPVKDILIGTAGAVVPFLLFLFMLSEKGRKLSLFGSLRKTVLVELREFFLHARLLDLVLISLLAGIAEEILFRGVLQAKYGILFASVVFGLLHFVSPAYFIAATAMGFYIGAIYMLSSSLLVPVCLHFIYDLAALAYLKFRVWGGNKNGCI